MKQIKCKYVALFYFFLSPLRNAILKPYVFYPYNLYSVICSEWYYLDEVLHGP